MPVQEVLQIGNPILRKKSTEATVFGPPLDQMLFDLKDTLTFLQKKKKIGRALAAPRSV